MQQIEVDGYEDGKTVTHESIPREVRGMDGITVCDWRNWGVWDILVGTCYAVFYLENLGTNSSRFLRNRNR